MIIPNIRNTSEYSSEDSDYSFLLFLKKKAPIIPNIRPRIPIIHFKLINENKLRLFRIFVILPNIRPKIPIIHFYYFYENKLRLF